MASASAALAQRQADLADQLSARIQDAEAHGVGSSAWLRCALVGTNHIESAAGRLPPPSRQRTPSRLVCFKCFMLPLLPRLHSLCRRAWSFAKRTASAYLNGRLGKKSAGLTPTNLVGSINGLSAAMGEQPVEDEDEVSKSCSGGACLLRLLLWWWRGRAG